MTLDYKFNEKSFALSTFAQKYFVIIDERNFAINLILSNFKYFGVADFLAN